MKSQNNINQEKSKNSAQGSITPKARPQGDKPEIKEGNPNQQRPAYGSDAGPNTSSREEQLPSLGVVKNIDNEDDLDKQNE